MGKEKIEKILVPGQRLSKEKADKIIKDCKLGYSEEDKKAGRDLEYFVVITKDRGTEPVEKRKDVSHYIHKWAKIPDQELDLIPIEEVIKAIQKYYPEIDPGEKCPTREAVRKLRKRKEEIERRKKHE